MKVVVTARNFTAYSKEAYEMLVNKGYEVVLAEDALKYDKDKFYHTVKDADAVIAGVEEYDRKIIGMLPNLKVISRRGIGVDSIDVDACNEHNIIITRTVGLVEPAVAEQTMAYMLYFGRKVEEQSCMMIQGNWKRSLQSGIQGRTLGLVGFGGIGKEIARRAAPFEMKILYYRPHGRDISERSYEAVYSSLDNVLAKSDFVVMCVPLNKTTKKMADMSMFKKMKRSAYFINIARGGIMNENDLKDALNLHIIAGAAVDVYEKEPCTDSVLAECQNIILTPHSSPMTPFTLTAMNKRAAENVIKNLKIEEAIC